MVTWPFAVMNLQKISHTGNWQWEKCSANWLLSLLMWLIKVSVPLKFWLVMWITAVQVWRIIFVMSLIKSFWGEIATNSLIFSQFSIVNSHIWNCHLSEQVKQSQCRSLVHSAAHKLSVNNYWRLNLINMNNLSSFCI